MAPAVVARARRRVEPVEDDDPLGVVVTEGRVTSAPIVTSGEVPAHGADRDRVAAPPVGQVRVGQVRDRRDAGVPTARGGMAAQGVTAVRDATNERVARSDPPPEWPVVPCGSRVDGPTKAPSPTRGTVGSTRGASTARQVVPAEPVRVDGTPPPWRSSRWPG